MLKQEHDKLKYQNFRKWQNELSKKYGTKKITKEVEEKRRGRSTGRMVRKEISVLNLPDDVKKEYN